MSSMEVTSSASQVNATIQNGQQLLDQAHNFVNTVSSTAQKMQDTYDKIQGAITTGRHVYDTGQNIWFKFTSYIEPVTARAEPLWNLLSNNNDPVRIVIIIGVAIAIWSVIRWRTRRPRYRDYYDR